MFIFFNVVDQTEQTKLDERMLRSSWQAYFKSTTGKCNAAILEVSVMNTHASWIPWVIPCPAYFALVLIASYILSTFCLSLALSFSLARSLSARLPVSSFGEGASGLDASGSCAVRPGERCDTPHRFSPSFHVHSSAGGGGFGESFSGSSEHEHKSSQSPI